ISTASSFGSAGDSPMASSFFAAAALPRYSFNRASRLFFRSDISLSLGERPVQRKKAARSRSRGDLASRRIRSASFRDASTKPVSFNKASACSGVLVLDSRTQQISRPAASKAASTGGGDVRFQYVYRLRR